MGCNRSLLYLTYLTMVSTNRYLQNYVMNIINLEGGGLSPHSPLSGSAPALISLFTRRMCVHVDIHVHVDMCMCLCME